MQDFLDGDGGCANPHGVHAKLLLPSATKLRRLCFYTCLSFCSQGGRGLCLSACWDTNPTQTRHPPGSRHPPREQTPPQTRHPPRSRHPPPADGHYCGRYACYWNAFLFGQFFPKTALKQDSIKVGCVPPASVVTTRCQYWWGGRSRVSSDDHGMSVAGSEWEVPYLISGGRSRYPCPNALWELVIWEPPSINRMTDTCKNITFPQLRLWPVIKEIERDVPWRGTPSPRSANYKGVLRVGLCCM